MKKGLFTPFYFPPIDCFRALTSHQVTLEYADRYEKQSYRNRCYIYGANGLLPLIVPVQHDGNRRGADRKIAYDTNWQAQHWKSLQAAYRRAPYFEFYEETIRPLYEKPERFLYDWNQKTLAVAFRLLYIKFSLQKTKVYQSTPIDSVDFRESFQAKNRNTRNFIPYAQVFENRHGFLPNLSILDLLFCMGPESPLYL